MELSLGDPKSASRPSAVCRAGNEAACETALAKDWIVLEHAGGNRPSLVSFPFAAYGLRDALASATPFPLDFKRLAFVPLTDVGEDRSTGSLHGIGIVPHRDFKQGFELTNALETLFRRTGCVPLVLRVPVGPLGWLVRNCVGRPLPALRPERWLGFSDESGRRTATTWASVTPLLLDRTGADTTWSAHERSLRRSIEAACGELELPPPSRVFSSPESPLRGARPVPKRRRLRTLTHAVVEFDQPVRGPIILGRGAALGLGLFLPMAAR